MSQAANNKKRPIDIDLIFERIATVVADLPKAALFELAEEGFVSPFEQLAACIISIRTLDEVTLLAGRRLFARARTPEQVSKLDPAEIDALIHPCTFHERKANQILAIARQVVAENGGELPCDDQLIRSFSGVGIKCTHLVLAIACNQPRISVDVHVDRITNRWGYVQTSTPEQTTLILEEILPYKYWVDINRLLVPFGKHICTGRLPHCSTCPVLDMCSQVGVKAHR